MRTLRISIALVLLFAAGRLAFSGTLLLSSDQRVEQLGDARVTVPDISPGGAPALCGLAALAPYGFVLPDGGTLQLDASFDSARNNANGSIAFYSRVAGVARNQGYFVAGPEGIKEIVRGCGAGGGSGAPGSCGDPSPVGGTFAGFFGGTLSTSDINVLGDVLFLADIYGGSSNRGLFLYREATRQIVKIAAVGDPSPVGGTFGSVGPGSLNPINEDVVFLAGDSRGENAGVFRWSAGTVTKIVAPGDPAPGGGVFSFVGGEILGFVDGTYIPLGPVPDINASGQIAFRGALTSGVEGLLVEASGTTEWFVRTGEATPGGGTYLNFYGPILNDAGQIAFVAEYQPEPSIRTAAWFAGTPKGWRKVMGFGDAIAGGTCQTLAVSRAPMQPLGEDGSVTVWCVAEYAGGVQAEVLAVSRPDIGLQVVARQNEPAPGGGLLRRMNAWPSISRSGVTVSASTFGTPSFGAHILGLLPTEITSLRASKPFSLSWVAQLNLSYDTIRGTLGALRATGPPANGDCVASGIRAASYSEPESACPAGVGDGCFYLVRGVNACGVSTWDSAAFDSNVSCP